MVRVYIAHQQKKNIKILDSLLSKLDYVDVAYKTDDGSCLVNKIISKLPDIVFIDIGMINGNNLTIAQRLREEYENLPIVMIAEDESYMKFALEIYVTDYMTPPYSFDRIRKTIQRINNNIQPTPNDLNEESKELEYIQQGKTKLFLQANEINFITRIGRKLQIYTDDTVVFSNESLDGLEKKLGSHFIRTHRGFIINLKKVKEIVPIGKKTYLVKFHRIQETALMTSTKYRRLFLRK